MPSANWSDYCLMQSRYNSSLCKLYLLQHKEHRTGLVACAHKKEATLICRHEGGLRFFFFMLWAKCIFNAEKIGFKNSSSFGGKKKSTWKNTKFGVVFLLGLFCWLVGFFFCWCLPNLCLLWTEMIQISVAAVPFWMKMKLAALDYACSESTAAAAEI